MNICWNRIRLALVALACVGLSGCDWVLLDSKGMVGLAQRDLILICIGLMLIVVIPAIVLTFVFAWRYRAGNTKAKYMPDWSHSTKVEIVVWGVPLIIIAVLAVIVWKSTHELDPYKPLDVAGEPLHVDVIATDWKWVFVYPDLGIATVNQLNFPANRPLAFNITSNSTMNTFFIPQLGGQIYAMAGMTTKLHLIANENGEFDGISANYSGAGFTGMKFKAVATSQADFEAWVNEVKQSPKQLDKAEYEALAKASENNPVTLYSVAPADQFQTIVDKYEGMNRGKPVVHEKAEHKEAAVGTGTEGMDVSMHSAAGAEE